MSEPTLQKEELTIDSTPGAEVAEVVSTEPLLPKRTLKKGEYIATIGRRKTSTCQVRLSLGGKETEIVVNGKTLEEYFPTVLLQKVVKQPLAKTKYQDAFIITAIVSGGGDSGQAQAVRHAITRALVQYDPNTRTTVKKLGYLKRDPRSKERKKPGLKKARKAAAWSKR